jgi:hypothetical protein
MAALGLTLCYIPQGMCSASPSLALHDGPVLQVALACLFFVYIRVDAIPKSDIACTLLVIVIW